jgi:hypothetical protein
VLCGLPNMAYNSFSGPKPSHPGWVQAECSTQQAAATMHFNNRKACPVACAPDVLQNAFKGWLLC